MKLAAAVVLVLLLPVAASFAFTVVRTPLQSTTTTPPAAGRSSDNTRLKMSSSTVVTGPQGQPASSFEEDLRLTLQLILDHEARSATTSKEQMVQQVQESLQQEKEAIAAEPIDVSIPYDAAALLAYEASDQKMEYAAFKEQYEAAAVADVIAKKPIDVSIPYDAAARLAYQASDQKMDYAAFKAEYEADAVAAVMAKQPKKETTKPAAATAPAASVDLSIPYDAAAKLAYEASDKSLAYPDFKAKFEADAVADVIAKTKKETAAAA